MENNKIVLPYVDGIPTDANQVRISWLVNGEAMTGSGNRFRAEGSLNKLHFQLYQNINTIKNSVNSFYGVYQDIQDEFKGLKETVLEFDGSIKDLQESSELTLMSVQGLIDTTNEHEEKLDTIENQLVDHGGEYEILKTQLGALEERNEEYDLKFNEYYTKEENDITISYYYNGEKIDEMFSMYYTKEEVDTLNENNVKEETFSEFMEDYYTRLEIDQLLEDLDVSEAIKEEIYSKVYTKEEVNELIDKFITNDDIDSKFSEYYKKDQVDSLLSNKATVESVTTLEGKVYQKDEVDDIISSAVSNKADKSELEKKADITSLNLKADKSELEKKANVSALNLKADKSDLDNKADLVTVTELSSKVDKNTSDIVEINTNLGAVNGVSVSALTKAESAIETIQLLQRTVAEMETRLAELESKSVIEGE